ncbi:MAG: hypothetical protein ACR2L1_01830, partial [Pyrinomonadaceae bacterium]
GKSLLIPSDSRKPAFTSYNFQSKGFRFACLKCTNEIEVEYDKLTGKGMNWEEKFDAKIVGEIKQYYDMNAVGGSPDGGETAVIEFSCAECQTKYLIYAGIKEPSPAFYVVTLQSITEILES